MVNEITRWFLNEGTRDEVRMRVVNAFAMEGSGTGMNYALPGERLRDAPKHDDIKNDLSLKRSENFQEYLKLYALAKKIYECHDVADSEMASIGLRKGLPVDHVLKVLKWLFIEQDIRYWNYSGRMRTWTIVPEPITGQY